MGPTSIINGEVLAFGANNLLQLGGSGIGSFDVSLIGPAAQYQGFDTFNKIGAATWTLTGFNAGALPWTVQQGILLVNGSLANSPFTVNGGTLGGTGTIGNTQVNSGGTLAPGSGAPGTSLTIHGNLAFQSGALYLVQVNSTTASLANVTGTASLAGTVQANIASATNKSYDILHSAGLGGTTFKRVVFNNPNFSGSLSYTATDVFLTPRALSAPGSNLNQNQQNVANAINNFFNTGGALPPNFVNIFGLTGGALGNALTQLDGEAATGAERAVFQLTNEFLDTDARSVRQWPRQCRRRWWRARLCARRARQTCRPTSRSPTPRSSPRRRRRVSSNAGPPGARLTAAPTMPTATRQPAPIMSGRARSVLPAAWTITSRRTRWSASRSPAPAPIGGWPTRSAADGAMRCRPAPTASAGSVRPIVAGALSFSNHWFTTNRSALGDALTANFVGQGYGARLEGGYRYAVLPAFAVTPYGAVQFQDFNTPAYSETDMTGGGFGLYVRCDERDRRAHRAWRALRRSDGRLQQAAHSVRPPRLGARLCLQSDAERRVSSAAGRHVHGQRRADPAELGADHGGRAALPDAAMDTARQVRRRVRARLADLRRHRHAALYVVTSVFSGQTHFVRAGVLPLFVHFWTYRVRHRALALGQMTKSWTYSIRGKRFERGAQVLLNEASRSPAKGAAREIADDVSIAQRQQAPCSLFGPPKQTHPQQRG